jgi:hypothetical protein
MKHDIHRLFDQKFGALDVVGEIGFKERQICFATIRHVGIKPASRRDPP